MKAAVLVGAVGGATLVAAPQAWADVSADISIAPEIMPYVIWSQGTGGTIAQTGVPDGNNTTSIAVAPGTSLSGAVLNGTTQGGYQYVWQGANHDLFTTSAHGPADTGLAMMPGTSPSLVTFPDGNWLVAVNGADGQLHTTGSWGPSPGAGPAMAPDASPSVAAVAGVDRFGHPLVDSFVFAWRGPNNDLWVGAHDNYDTGLAMAAGTNPSVTRMTDKPQVNDRFLVTYQGSDGQLWWDVDGASKSSPINQGYTNVQMAPGTSPSAGMQRNGWVWTAVHGSNGDLWTYLGAGGIRAGDTGLAMKAGSSPSLMATPDDVPGYPTPLTDDTFYVGYASSAGNIYLYGYNWGGTTDIVQDTGQSVAPGTNPSIVSDLNWFHHAQIVTDAPPTAATGMAPAATARPTPVPLNLPSKPTIMPNTAPVVVSDTCASARANLKQYAARGIKQVSCMTTTNHPATTPSGTRAVAPDIAGTSLCSGPQWAFSRTEECYQNFMTTGQTLDPQTGATIGTTTYLVSRDITMATNSTKITEKSLVSLVDETGFDKGRPVTWTLTPGCGSLCQVTSPSTVTFTISINQTLTWSFTYQDNPGTQAPDTFSTFFSLSTSIPGTVPIGQPTTWNSGAPIRCDNNTPGFTNPGCVVPSVTPTLVLPVSQYGAAAVNVYLGENFLAGTPGRTPTTPLTRGDPNRTNPNRAIVCNGFQPNTALVPGDSCDEYPFASSQQSGGALGLSAADCLEVLPLQLVNRAWSYTFLNNYTGTQKCMRGHVNSTLNTSVGNQALNPMYTNARMMIGDPYTVQVVN